MAAVPPLLCCAYLFTLALSALRPPRFAASRSGHRLAVLIPAHNEELLVARCVRSLLAQTWPERQRRVIVIADNCSDSTARVAGEAGAEVWQRTDPNARGKGRALRWAIDRLLAEPSPPDAVAVVDADSLADPGLLEHLDAGLERSPAVQAEYLVLADPGSRRSRLVALGFLLFHRVRLGGRAGLGLPAALVGNGMLFARALLEEQPWDAFSGVEDLEYTLRLRLAGIRPAYAPQAVVFGPVAAGGRATVRQRERWEGGRLHAMRVWFPRLGRQILRGRLDLLDAAVDLAVPPLAILAGGVALGAAAGTVLVITGAPAGWAVGGWILAAALLLGFIVVGLVAAGAAAADWLALLAAPGLIGLKLVAYRRFLSGFDPGRWERTARTAERPGQAVVGGVRIDAMTMEAVRTRLRLAFGSGRLHQVATVNMDFLARAQVNPEVRAVLNQTALNIPDGAPVVWLGRLRGLQVPERVAGADLVPLLVGDAARAGSSVFLLGGEGGAAAAAARVLQARIPGLQVAGVLEPPRSPLEAMDNDAILAAIRASGADLLLVALGHPKQDLWIARHAGQLPVSVAVGVGCAFDLLAGRVRRAPTWMQGNGLEWLFRLFQEPGRLASRYATDLRWLITIAAGGLYERVLLQPSEPA